MTQKRRWGGCWSLYWCFGSHKSSKRISHAVLVPEPTVPGAPEPVPGSLTNSTAVILPFIVPPSSPASFLQSDPPSAAQTPCGLLSLTSLSVNAGSPGGTASIFTIGPYAHETQLVSPPVLSTYTTEPSTAAVTPHPGSVQHTTPSSPEVPFAQLLTSSLNRPRRNSGSSQKFTPSHYEFQTFHVYPGSPGGHLISPGSAISNSGTSSPFPDGHMIYELRNGLPPKLLRLEHFMTRKWGSRLGSGTLTPDGMGLGSRLGSGSLTPDGAGLGSRLGSGTLTPDGGGPGSRLDSGTLTPKVAAEIAKLNAGSFTPNASSPASRDNFLLENQIAEVASLANSENGSKTDDTVIQRVSFELSGEDVARCFESKSMALFGAETEYVLDEVAESTGREGTTSANAEDGVLIKNSSKNSGKTEDEHYYQKHHRSVSFDSIKEFKFDNTKGDASDKPIISAEWWANEKVSGKEGDHASNWSFFPVLQHNIS